MTPIQLLFIICLALISVFPHEFGHILIARHWKVRIVKISFFTKEAWKKGGFAFVRFEHNRPLQHDRMQDWFEVFWWFGMAGTLALLGWFNWP